MAWCCLSFPSRRSFKRWQSGIQRELVKDEIQSTLRHQLFEKTLTGKNINFDWRSACWSEIISFDQV